MIKPTIGTYIRIVREVEDIMRAGTPLPAGAVVEVLHTDPAWRPVPDWMGLFWVRHPDGSPFLIGLSDWSAPGEEEAPIPTKVHSTG